MTRLISVSILIVSLAFTSCKKEQEKTTKAPIPVSVTSVIQKDVPLYSDYVAQIYGLKDIPIRARVEGVLENIHFDEGRRVKKKQLLYTIDEQQYLADVTTQRGILNEAKTRLINAENNYKRIKPLAEQNAVSQSDLDQAIADRDAAKASVNSAQANLELAQINLGYCKIYAPISGVIGITKARVGEFVGRDPNPVILNTVSLVDTIRVQFSLSESDYLEIMRYLVKTDKIKTINENRTSDNLELILADGSVHSEKGRLDFINREVDQTTGAIKLQASFANPHGIIRPGSFGKIRARMEVVKNAILVPQKAVVELQGKYQVSIVEEGNKISKKNVTVGSKFEDYWIIKEGINANDKVVYEGFQKIRNGMEVTPQDKPFKSQFGKSVK